MSDFNFDVYMRRLYEPNYTCWDFASDIWYDLTGHRIDVQVPKDKHQMSIAAALMQGSRDLDRIEKAVDPCLVLITKKGDRPHIGVFYRGKILHLDRNGAQYARSSDFAKANYHMRFYK